MFPIERPWKILAGINETYYNAFRDGSDASKKSDKLISKINQNSHGIKI